MSTATNRHNLYVVTRGPRRGTVVRERGQVLDTVLFQPLEDTGLDGAPFKLSWDDVCIVGCVTAEQWTTTTGPTADLCALAREGVKRTVEHVLSERCAHCGETFDACKGSLAR